MKHLRDLAWHPSWDETAKQLATQAAGAAAAFVRLRADAEWADLCVQALRSLGGDAEAEQMLPGPRRGVPWPLKRPSGCSRHSAIKSRAA